MAAEVERYMQLDMDGDGEVRPGRAGPGRAGPGLSRPVFLVSDIRNKMCNQISARAVQLPVIFCFCCSKHHQTSIIRRCL